MDNINTIIALIYAIVAVMVAIISATIIRAKMSNWDRFDIEDALFSLVLGAWWPLTVVAWIVYLASDFLYNKFCKAKES